MPCVSVYLPWVDIQPDMYGRLPDAVIGLAVSATDDPVKVTWDGRNSVAPNP
jgi:hypothetical protein